MAKVGEVARKAGAFARRLLRALVVWSAAVFAGLFLWNFVTIALGPTFELTAFMWVFYSPLWVVAWLIGLIGWFWPRKD